MLLCFPVFLFSQIDKKITSQNIRNLQEYMDFSNKSTKSSSDTNSNSPSLDTLFVNNYSDSLYKNAELNYFGYSFFMNRDFIEISDNITPPRDYILGPGDVLVLSIWGDVQLRKSYTVDKNGSIFIDSIGLLDVGGNTLNKAENILFNKFRTVYSTLGGKNPSTFFNLSVDMIKHINITISGEASFPGVYAIHSSSTLTMALIKSGGIKNTGSLRSIQIIRNNDIIKELDMYDLLISGKFDDNIFLKNNDIIHIPIRKSSITISGDVVRDGIYEFIEGENFGDLLLFAGGVNPTATKKVGLRRVVDIQKRISTDNSYFNDYLSIGDLDFKLQDGDVYDINKIPNTINKVTVFGQVKIPGEYSFENSMTLMDVLEMAGGINDITYRKSMYLKNAEIIRRNPKTQYPETINVDLNKLLSNKSSTDVSLENLDFILVRENPNYIIPEKVDVAGEVNSPGIYTIQSKGESVQDIINRAGGFTDKAFSEGVSLYRDDSQVVLYDYSINVKDGDSLTIPQYPGVVNVVGDVYNEGLIQFKEGKGSKYYIRRAGGFNPLADRRNIVIVYPNGDIKLHSSIFKPKIKEGSTIIVNSKVLSEPFNVTEFMKEMASIAASFATIALIFNQTQP